MARSHTKSTVTTFPYSKSSKPFEARMVGSRPCKPVGTGFLEEYDWDDADGASIIGTAEALDLRHWCWQQSWS